MKKFYLMAASIVIAVSANAQVNSTQQNNAGDLKVASAPYQIISNEYVPSNNHVEKFGPVSYYIDYAAYNIDPDVIPNGLTATGGRYIMDALAAPLDSQVTSIATNLRPYTGFSDYNDLGNTLMFVNSADQGATITVDSLFFDFGHSNSTGTMNKILIYLRTGSNGNFGSAGTFTIPNGTIFWKDSIESDVTLSPSGSAFGTGSTVNYAAAVGYTHSLASGDLTTHIIPIASLTAGDTIGIGGFGYDDNSSPVQANSLATFSEDAGSIYLLRLSWNVWTKVTFSSQASAENLENNGFTLHSFMPNPADISTNINFELATPSDVRFDIIDMNGRMVKSVDLGNQAAGKTNYTLNTSDLSTGIYNVVMRANNSIFSKKLSVVH